MANLALYSTPEYWQELGADLLVGWLRRVRMSTEQKALDKCVARAMRRTAHYRLHRAHCRADAYVWTLDCDDGFHIGGEVARAHSAIVDEVRRQGYLHEVTIHTDPLRVEILRQAPALLPLSAVWRQVMAWPQDQFLFSPGMTPIVGKHRARQLGLTHPRIAQMTVAGGTGSGKTTLGINIMLTLAATTSPQQCRMLIIDPKQIDMANSDLQRLPHLVAPIITDPGQAVAALYAVAAEMQARREEIAAANAAGKRWLLPDRTIVYVDELAHLVRVDPNITAPLTWIAAEGRGLGYHLIIGTQRPTVDVMPGHLRANTPCRFAGWVRSAEEARIATGLPASGAEKLSGDGHFIMTIRSQTEIVHGYAISLATELPAMVDAVCQRWPTKARPLAISATAKSDMAPVLEETETKLKDDTAMLDALLAIAHEEGGLDKISLNRISSIGEQVEGAGIGRTRAKRLLEALRGILNDTPTDTD